MQDYRVNHRIRVPEVRLIDEEGEQVGVVDTKRARQRAQELGLDLVEVSPQARPPVCKIMDFGKFKYQQRKKEKQGERKVVSQLKELRVRPAIDKHDLSYRLENGRKFLMQGHKVQVVCIFRGRQMAHPEHGFDVMKQVAEDLDDISKVESPPKMAGRRMTMLLSVKPAAVKAILVQQKKEQDRLEQSKAAKAENVARAKAEAKAKAEAEAAEAAASTDATAEEAPAAEAPIEEAQS